MLKNIMTLNTEALVEIAKQLEGIKQELQKKKYACNKKS